MSLFKMGSDDVEDTATAFVDSGSVAECINAASIRFFKSQLKSFEMFKHYHYATGGQWNMHDLLLYLLGITGSADVFITTWSITEEPVRALINAMDAGLIKTLNCVFDHKVKEQKSKAFLLAESNFTSVTLAKCHAKVTLIVNDVWQVSISGSANYTRNPRAERGLICTVPGVASFDKQWIEAIINQQQPFKVR